mgnify:CR=1 FL=1
MFGRHDVHVVVERAGPALDLEDLVAGRRVRIGRAVDDLRRRSCASARAFSGYEPSLAIMMPSRPISVSTTGQNACRLRPYFSTHQS